MAQPFINHNTIAAFAADRVNLPGDKAQAHRDQVNRLRERLAKHIAENPGFALVKMLHAGSVAKGMGLKTINDLDVAVYVKKEDAPVADTELVPWLADRLREANPNLKPDQFDESQPHCVKITYRGTGLDVDVVPVLYEGDKDDLGYLIDKDSGDRTLTSIPRHLEFIRKRKNDNPGHFAQVVRLIKWWVRHQKDHVDEYFKCKSFMVELITAYLADQGMNLKDYPSALDGFFSYIVKTELQERIYFTDYYSARELPETTGAPIEIFDPINSANNITDKYTLVDRDRLVAAAVWFRQARVKIKF